MARSGIIAWLALILVVVAGALAPSASATPPTFERINVNETFFDQDLSDECGFDVTVHEQGHVTIREFSGKRAEDVLVTLNIAVTVTGRTGNSVTVRNVGKDLTKVQPDGTVVLKASGQSPFAFKGVLKVNLNTGEVIHEPQRTLNVQEVCASVAP
jgi:hypothetical protein